MSGVAVHSIIRAVGAAVTEPRSQRTNSRTVVAGRATCVFDTRSNVWIGWQMLMVNSAWLDPNAMPAPVVKGRLANVMSTARTELRTRRSDLENNSLISPRRSLSRTVLARVQGPSSALEISGSGNFRQGAHAAPTARLKLRPKMKRGRSWNGPCECPAENENGYEPETSER